MTLFERIKLLANKRDKSLKEVAVELGFSENLFYRWKTTEPKGVDLKKVADYFNVSVDYLLGRTDSQNLTTLNIVTDTDLDKILDGVMSFDGKPLTDEDREAVRAFMQGRKSK